MKGHELRFGMWFCEADQVYCADSCACCVQRRGRAAVAAALADYQRAQITRAEQAGWLLAAEAATCRARVTALAGLEPGAGS